MKPAPLVERHPDKTIGFEQMIADVFDRKIRQVGTVFVGNAVDEHLELWFVAAIILYLFMAFRRVLSSSAVTSGR